MKIKLDKLEPWNPFESCVWVGISKPIRKEEVSVALECMTLRSEPIPDWNFISPAASRDEHVKRVAFFVINKDNNPIQIDVGVPELGCHVSWIIIDGNHRLAAAFYRNDLEIEADVSGSLNKINEMFS